jgi:hypothetical protein
MLLSVILAIINPCTYLGGDPCTNLENKTLSYSIIENSKCLSVITKRERLKVHLGPRVSFGGLITNN